jgi:hypothetical protein
MMKGKASRRESGERRENLLFEKREDREDKGEQN